LGGIKLIKFKIVVKKGEDKKSFLGEMNNISSSSFIPSRQCQTEQLSDTRCFYALMTEEEANLLLSDPRIQAVQKENKNAKRVPLGYPSSSRRNPYKEENLKIQGFDANASINGLPGGFNVDVVIVDGTLNINNPELKNALGQSRFKYVNWNSYCSLGGIYSEQPGPSLENEHGQHVSGTACGRYQGWARRCNVYNIFPYNEKYYEYMIALKNWHLSKTNGNPTITNHSYGYATGNVVDLRNILRVNINGNQLAAPRNDTGASAITGVSGGLINQITLVSNGTGYTNRPNVSFYGGGYDTAVAVLANNSIREVHITNSGSGYNDSSPPTVTFSAPPSGGTRALGTCVVYDGKIFKVIISERGSGYTSNPTMTFGLPPSGGVRATGTTTIGSKFIKNINITNGGKNHSDYYSIPDLIISGGHPIQPIQYTPSWKEASWSVDEKIRTSVVGLTGAAKYSNGSWSSFGANIDYDNGDLITIIKKHSSTLYAGGVFSKIGGMQSNSIAEYKGGSWFSLGKGVKYSNGDPGLVWELGVDSSGALYVGGNFDVAGDTNVNNIAKYHNGVWSSLGDGIKIEGSIDTPNVQAIAFDSTGAMYVGGKFNKAGGISANNIAKYHNGVWSSMGNGLTEVASSYSGAIVYDILIDGNDNVYICGQFDTAGGVSASNVAKYKNGVWTSISSSTNETVLSLAIDSSGSLFAGGFFTSIGGTNANGVAKYNGTSWAALGSGVTDPIFPGPGGCSVLKMEFDSQDNLYLIGSFALAGGVQAKNVAKYKNGVWSSMNSGNDVVHCLSVESVGNLFISGYIFVGGSGIMQNGIYKIDEFIQTISNTEFKQTLLGGEYNSTPLVSFIYRNEFGPTAVANVLNGVVTNISYNGSGSLATTYTSSPSVVFTNGGGFTKKQLDDWGIAVGGMIPARDVFADSLIEDLIDVGVVVVAAAGNESFRISNSSSSGYNDSFTFLSSNLNYPKSNPSILRESQESEYTHSFAKGSSPGSTEGVICVGSMRSGCCPERKSSFSNSGSRITVYAAGSNIISSINYLSESSKSHPVDPSTFLDKWDGTSMASPQVAGAIACYAQNNRNINQAIAMSWINENSRQALIEVPGSAGTYLYGGTDKILFYPGITVYMQS
jgi:hypothetical protein